MTLDSEWAAVTSSQRPTGPETSTGEGRHIPHAEDWRGGGWSSNPAGLYTLTRSSGGQTLNLPHSASPRPHPRPQILANVYLSIALYFITCGQFHSSKILNLFYSAFPRPVHTFTYVLKSIYPASICLQHFTLTSLTSLKKKKNPVYFSILGQFVSSKILNLLHSVSTPSPTPFLPTPSSPPFQPLPDNTTLI
ncbi:hypothetical protein E2C01_068307 [Portunus trituberculatus]|uniref:Uncharacterized protein n=1 Tax=Portunus trituberculatus TaxID=210409 RepID=A0A5B7HZP2_PORTR|nr:hypothetical protein [Portunus trituberculatus]